MKKSSFPVKIISAAFVNIVLSAGLFAQASEAKVDTRDENKPATFQISPIIGKIYF